MRMYVAYPRAFPNHGRSQWESAKSTSCKACQEPLRFPTACFFFISILSYSASWLYPRKNHHPYPVFVLKMVTVEKRGAGVFLVTASECLARKCELAALVARAGGLCLRLLNLHCHMRAEWPRRAGIARASWKSRVDVN